MRYSIYNYDRRQYDYYDGSGPSGTHAGAPPRRGSTELGCAPEQAAWKLPPGAVKVGEGDLPQGRIASLGDFGGGDGVRLAFLALAVFIAWKVLR